MKAKYKIYTTCGLLAEAFFGEINLQDLLDINQHQHQQKNYGCVKIVLSDARQCNIKMTIDELSAYIDELKKIMSKKPLRWAMVSYRPSNTALSMIIKDDAFFDNRVGVFSTMEAAIRFLNIDMGVSDVLKSNYQIVE